MQRENSISGGPKLTFHCEICDFTMRTCGLPTSCPRCHFDPVAIENKEAERLREGAD